MNEPAVSVKPKFIRAAAVLQLLYGLIEVSDCLTALLMAAGWLANPYPRMLFREVQTLFDQQPIWLLPLFLFYTGLRLTSAVGLWKKRLWGFWLALYVSAATIVMAPFLLPFTTLEMLLNGLLVSLLFIGYFGDRSLG